MQPRKSQTKMSHHLSCKTDNTWLDPVRVSAQQTGDDDEKKNETRLADQNSPRSIVHDGYSKGCKHEETDTECVYFPGVAVYRKHRASTYTRLRRKTRCR